jgi:hypothetical protein
LRTPEEEGAPLNDDPWQHLRETTRATMLSLKSRPSRQPAKRKLDGHRFDGQSASVNQTNLAGGMFC